MIDGPDAIAAPGLPSNGVTADFNHDGALDLATADYGGTVSVFFGRGDGSFSSSESYTTDLGELTSGWGPIVVADLDDNDEQDLVTARATGVSVLLGTRDGSFGAEVTYDVSFDAWGVAIGDWTGDQTADLVVVGTTDYDGYVSVLEGQGDGSFGSEEPLWNGTYTRAIAAADLDADDNLDLVVSGFQSVGVPGVIVLLGDGLGGYGNENSYETWGGGIDVTIADFTRDRVLDIVVESTCDDFGDPGLMGFLGNGDGTFEGDDAFHDTISCPHRTMAGDVNGDDVPDMVGDLHRVMLSDGNGGFLPQPEVSGASTLVGNLVGLGDFDGDGRLDAATASSGWLAVRTGRGDGSFRSPPVLELPAFAPSALVVADLDGNDKPDIVATASGTLDVLLGAGDRSFAAPVTYEAASHTGALYALDFNGDNTLDLATLDEDNIDDRGGISVRLATNPGEYAPAVRYSLPGSNITKLAAGDVNADGIVDFVVTNYYPALITVLIGEGDGTFVALPDQPAMDGPVAVALSDTNQDARLDLVLGNYVTRVLNVWFGQGDGTFAPGPDVSTDDISPMALEFGHLDGDNLPDLVVMSGEGEPLRVLLSNGDGSFRAAPNPNTVTSHARVVDFNQDGKNDVVCSTQALDPDGSPYLSVLFGNGDGSFACNRGLGIWGEAPVFDVADVDADGRVDVVTRTETDISVFPNLPR